MKHISLLGSTGSIGRNALDVVSRFPGEMKVVALASRSDGDGVLDQARRFKPKLVALFEKEAADKVRDSLKDTGIEVLSGAEGIIEAAALKTADIVVSAIVGSAGIMPTFAAVKAGKRVALANKETLVAAGALIISEARAAGAQIMPVDSEHSAIFQILMGQDHKAIKRLVLTASGGQFFGKNAQFLETVTPEMALKHPKWRMGPKVTVDSATMMNKGLEVIEAHWLFNLPGESIDVLIHPQSVVHSMVEFVDGSTLAQMGMPDMRLPIAFALSYPERLPLPFAPLDLASLKRLEFFRPDLELLPCLRLAYEVLEKGGGMPAVMNASNEVAVEAFLRGEIPFKRIPDVVESVVRQAPSISEDSLTQILRCDGWAREETRRVITLSREKK